MVGQVTEHIVAHLATIVDKEFAVITLWQWIFSDTLVGELIIEVGNVNIFVSIEINLCYSPKYQMTVSASTVTIANVPATTTTTMSISAIE